MRQWKPQQRIVFLAALGWVVFSIFSTLAVKAYIRNSYQFYLNDWMGVHYATVVAGAGFTAISLQIAFYSIGRKKPWEAYLIRSKFMFVLLMLGLGWAMIPGSERTVFTFTAQINTFLCMVVLLSFWPSGRTDSTPKKL